MRTALTVSCITGKAVLVRNVRRGRRVPGLRPQHVAAARILRDMCDGTLRGDVVGSDTLEFRPGVMRDCKMNIDVGTAGSIPLILQAAVPAAWAAGTRLDLTATGGTDVRWAPTIDYVRLVVGAAYAAMGARMSVDVLRRGYYPRGGGRVRICVMPGRLEAADFVAAPSGDITVRCSLWQTKAADAARGVVESLKNMGHSCTLHVAEEAAAGPGASVLAYRSGSGFSTGADSLYHDGFGQVARRLLESSSVDDNLADMLVVPASIAAGLSVIGVAHITKHLETALQVASDATGCRYGISRTQDGYQVRIRGIG